jgi:hypothetical protein
MAGRVDGCGKLLSEPEDPGFWPGRDPYEYVRDNSPLSAVHRATALVNAGRDAHVVAELHAEFGAERFRVFWNHPGSFEEAFADAFGVSHGAWNLKRVGKILPITPPGPALAAGAWRMGFTLMLALGLIAGLRARRVTVA